MSKESSMVECQLVLVSGQSLIVSVETKWKLWHLRGQVSREHHIPEYEQQFFKDDARLQSNQALSNLLLSADEGPMQISLIRHAMPACLPEPRAQALWEAFLALSGDHGDTVSTDVAHQVMLSAGFFERAQIFKDCLLFHTSMKFIDIVSFLSRRTVPEPLAVSLDVAIQELSVLDPRDTGLMRASVFFRAIDRLRKPVHADDIDTLDYLDGYNEVYKRDDSGDDEDYEDNHAREEPVAQEYATVQWKRHLREMYSIQEDGD